MTKEKTKEKEDIDIEWGNTEYYWKKDIEEAVTEYVKENKTMKEGTTAIKWIFFILGFLTPWLIYGLFYI